jgi:hypothetical protein
MTAETDNRWTIVDLAFTYPAGQGLHPALGSTGRPGEPAAALPRALGVAPTVEGDARVQAGVHRKPAEPRARVLDAGETP